MTQHIIDATQALVSKLSRRSALNWLGTGGLATAFVVGSHNIAKADNTPRVVQAWINAQNSQNAYALAALYTDDGILEDVPNQLRVQGRNNIQCFAQSAQQFLSNTKVEPQYIFTSRKWASLEYLFSATNIGFFPDPSTIGRSFTIRTVTIFDLKGNLIQRNSDYYDRTAAMEQLSMISPPPTATIPINACQ